MRPIPVRRLRHPESDCIFSTGTDEHGLKIQQAAALAGQLIIPVIKAGSESVSSLEFAWIRGRSDYCRCVGKLRGSNLGANFNIKNLPRLPVSSSYLLLKVPKCEIYDGSDCFFDFYTIKSPRWGDFGAKIICLKNIYGFICRFEFG
jgi:hypothetical protein